MGGQSPPLHSLSPAFSGVKHCQEPEWYEIEMHFPCPDADVLARSVIRYGATDHLGNILKTPHNGDAVRVIANRPQRNADWAFAIEVTEPCQES